MDSTFLTERIVITKALIVVYEDALLALGDGGAQEYLLDTGQTRTRVTKMDVGSLNRTLDSLYNRLANFCNRLNGSGSIVSFPAW